MNILNQDLIKLEFNEAKESSFKIYVKENATVQKDRRIGEYINHIGSKVPIISNFFGRIVKIDSEEKIVVIERCKHEMVFRSLCTACGCSMPKTQGYVSIHSDITFSEDKSKIEEENIVKKYLNDKKLILLLDIDNTILHASNFDVTKDEYENLKKIYDWEITYISIPLLGHLKTHPVRQKIFVKFRPMFKQLLESTKNTYDIYIYTQGTQEYAQEIIKYVNETFDYPYLSCERLVARTGLNWENKSIKRIFPTTEDMVVILDDRLDVWSQNRKNLINLVPYYFFYDEKSFRIKSKFRNEDDDYILFSVDKMLNFINESFYYYYNKNKEIGIKTDVKIILDHKIKNILDDKKFTFSGLYTKEIDIYSTRNGYLIDLLGGTLYQEYDEDVDVVLTKEFKSIKYILSYFLETDKIKKAKNEHKLILHEAWLEFCAFFFVRIIEEDFKLTLETPRLEPNKFKLEKVFINNKENIIEYYSTSKEKLDLFFGNINKEDDDGNGNENNTINSEKKMNDF